MAIFRQHCRDVGRRNIRTKCHVGIVLDHPQNYANKINEMFSVKELAIQTQNFEPPKNPESGGWGFIPLPCIPVHVVCGHTFGWGPCARKRCVRAAKKARGTSGEALSFGGAFGVQTDRGALEARS